MLLPHSMRGTWHGVCISRRTSWKELFACCTSARQRTFVKALDDVLWSLPRLEALQPRAAGAQALAPVPGREAARGSPRPA